MSRDGANLSTVIRIAIAATLVFVFTRATGDTLSSAFLPVLRWVYELVDRDHHVLDFVISKETALRNADWVYRLKVAPDSVVVVGTHVIRSDPRAWVMVSLLVSYLWQPLLTAVVVLAAFETRSPKEWLFRVAYLLPMLLLIALLDLPLVMWAEVWMNYTPLLPEGTFSPLLLWSTFLQHGGRLLLGALAGLLAVRFAAQKWPIGTSHRHGH